MKYFKKVIRRIVRSEGESLDNEDLYLNVESGSGSIMDLTVEKHSDELIVSQTYTQRGDLMRDPEIRFRIQDDGEWLPVEYRQDPNIREYCTDGIDIEDFLETWAGNLKCQFLR